MSQSGLGVTAYAKAKSCFGFAVIEEEDRDRSVGTQAEFMYMNVSVKHSPGRWPARTAEKLSGVVSKKAASLCIAALTTAQLVFPRYCGHSEESRCT